MNLNLPSSPQEQIEVALDANVKGMDIILINDEYCLHMSDFGVNAELIRKYEHSKIRGKIGYFLNSIPTLVQSNYPFQFQIKANGQVLQKEGILLAIANAKSYGTGATVNPNGKIDDGFFEILVFKNFDFLEILKTLRNEVELNPDFIEIISTQNARISCKNPVAFQVDGEYIGKRKFVEVSILPHKVKIASPLQ
ncbi:hypothetical protein LZ575_05090 [Antarcticibacterium sp. 1MA-6-2]|uniref:diacylglycerol/lipid kinase family protein n=1 Tax=Antarcticibacterium sp. 1MA-6-2 TaxID=2908210 RepID=UPI001F2E1190|nr:hypothetical protein [Antarcticibacterium sp. 1MA-6-2]UJH92002.1 hypothetical protein LZ575_05090 [Antarcticibacterium sp. 1MA-6-2]